MTSELQKYPRTSHLPWSPGFTEDDCFLSPETLLSWQDREVVVTEKMDGENTTLYRDNIHARSLDYESRYDRDRIKSYHAKMCHNIPEGWRVWGENLTAVHSLEYTRLPHFFLAYGLWCRDICFNWDDTLLYLEVMDIKMVPVLWRGPFRNFAHEVLEKQMDFNKQEGYVVRPLDGFTLKEFPFVVGKFVRPGHVAESHVHWTRRQIKWNSWIE